MSVDIFVYSSILRYLMMIVRFPCCARAGLSGVMVLFMLWVPVAMAVPEPGHETPGTSSPPAATPVKTVPVVRDAPAPPPAALRESLRTEPPPTATPQDVAARIAKKIAIMHARQTEKNLIEAPVRRPGPARKAAVVVPIAHPQTHALYGQNGTHWSYAEETGPLHWADMQADWARCSTGARQSPIDIRDGLKVDLEPITFDYKPAGFAIVDNGHTIQVNLGAGNSLTVGGHTYALVQFHFHRPSEEKINGVGTDMVMHLVHKDTDGRLAVVAVLLEKGAARKLIQTIWNNLPLEKDMLVTPETTIDLNEMLPSEQRYFTYMGSLTTPPCSEGVLWMVMKTPVSISQQQIGIFARLYPMNARPIQDTSARRIKESN